MIDRIILSTDLETSRDRLSRLWARLKPILATGALVVEVKPLTRSLEQNAKFHAICSELAGTVWAGKPRSADEWKVLLISGHAVATKQAIDVVPGLEGEFINLRESSARMSVARASSLIEYAESWLATTQEAA